MLLAKFRALHPYAIGVLIGIFLVASALSVAVVAHARPMSQRVVAPPTATATVSLVPTATTAQLVAKHPVGADFAAFYQHSNGSVWLGNAISPELPQQQSIVQFFEGGMLRVGPETNNAVVPVALTQQLLQQVAALPLVDGSAALTYAALVPKSQAAALSPAPWWWDATKDPVDVGIFLAQTMRQGVVYGYYIPAMFVPLLQKLGNWQSLLGSVLTPALDGTFTRDGANHHYTLVGFANAVLWVDRDTPGTPIVHTQRVGNDFVTVNGFSQVAPANGRAAWTLGAPMAINGSPNGGGEVAHFLTPFSVQLAGDGKWVGHDLWLHIRWVNFAKTRDGWVNADQLALTQPANLGMQLAALDALSPQAQAAANAHGTNVTMSIYDPATGHYYVYNPNEELEMASMFKVPILVTLLHNAEHEGRELNGDERQDTTSMIEVSDNDAEGRMYD
ncbi:MAG: hypothetical protein H0X24_21635, partial [Ktedonobacterales bacterium]|nr:hypothetical protein [Ktedonobacterales bacterium]